VGLAGTVLRTEKLKLKMTLKMTLCRDRLASAVVRTEKLTL
jgi:hypothetical protein